MPFTRALKSATAAVFKYAILVFTVAISVLPILWVMLSSFKTNGEIMSGPFVLPAHMNFNAYVYLFEKYNFLTYTLNSVSVSLVSTVAALTIFTLGAYVIARYQFPGKKTIYALFAITLLIPVHASTQPIFSMIVALNLYNTKLALMLVYTSFGMAVSMFLLRAAFQAIPNEITEAATIDGAGFVKTFTSINLPLAKNGIVSAGILMLLANWNEFYYANILITSKANRTLPIVTILFNSMFSYNYTNTFAALTVVILPGILFYAMAQRQVRESVAATGIKG